MNEKEIKKKISIHGVDQLKLFGLNDNNLKEIESHFKVKIVARGSELTFIGDQAEIKIVEKLFGELITILEKNDNITENDVITVIEVIKSGRFKDKKNTDLSSAIVFTKEGHIKPKTKGQQIYYKSTKYKQFH